MLRGPASRPGGAAARGSRRRKSRPRPASAAHPAAHSAAHSGREPLRHEASRGARGFSIPSGGRPRALLWAELWAELDAGGAEGADAPDRKPALLRAFCAGRAPCAAPDPT
jgi:hypothetical protein